MCSVPVCVGVCWSVRAEVQVDTHQVDCVCVVYPGVCAGVCWSVRAEVQVEHIRLTVFV